MRQNERSCVFAQKMREGEMKRESEREINGCRGETNNEERMKGRQTSAYSAIERAVFLLIVLLPKISLK